nr:hypothetical protein HmN_000468100 [Hymenolepis microstoma]
MLIGEAKVNPELGYTELFDLRLEIVSKMDLVKNIARERLELGRWENYLNYLWTHPSALHGRSSVVEFYFAANLFSL